MSGALMSPRFHNFFSIRHLKKMLDENDEEFDFTVGHVLVIFLVIRRENEKWKENHVSSTAYSKIDIHISISVLTHYFDQT